MPDPTNILQLQAQKAQESHDAVKAHALRQILNVFDPWYVPEGQPYAALLERVQTILHAEQALLRAPSTPPPSPPIPEGEESHV